MNVRNYILLGILLFLSALGISQISSIPAVTQAIVQYYQTVEDETIALTQRASINFTGTGVTCVDNAGTSTTDCTITSGSASGAFQTVITNLAPTVSTTSATSDTLNIAAGYCWGVSKSAATARITAGTGSGSYVAYCAPSGAYVVLYSTGAGLTLTCSGVTCTDSPSPAIPEGYYSIASGSISANTPSRWGSPTNLIDFTTRFQFLNGTGMNASVSGSVVTLAVDDTLVQMKADDYVVTADLDASAAITSKPMKVATSDPGTCSVGEFLFRSDSGATKACTSSNTWTTLGGSAPSITSDLFWPFGQGGQTEGNLNPGANIQRAYKFTPLANYSFSKIRYKTSGTGYVAFAIVTSNGNTIVTNSAGRCNNATPGAGAGYECSLGGTVSLTAGTAYYFVFTADSSTGIVVVNNVSGDIGYAGGTGFGTYIGQAANNSTGSAGTLAVSVPLGTISAITGSIAGNQPPAIVFVP